MNLTDNLIDRLLDEANETTVSKAPPFNKQLFENSPLSGSEVEQDYKGLTNGLYNDRQPNLAVLSEKPEHRIVIFLKAQGMSNNEIAKRTGYTYPWVSQLLRQPWARVRLVEEITASGRNAVEEMLKAAAEDSVYTLITERDNPTAKPAERISAANSLLDRFLGKPTQKVEQTIKTGKLDSLEDTERELAALEQEEARIRGTQRN